MDDWRGVRRTAIAGKAQECCRPGEGAFQHGRAVYCANCVTVSLSRCMPSAEEALPLEAGGWRRRRSLTRHFHRERYATGGEDRCDLVFRSTGIDSIVASRYNGSSLWAKGVW